MNNVIQLREDEYSEDVIRKSLYWLSEHCKWKLNKNAAIWEVQLISDSTEDHSTTLYRLLNDQILREKIDKRTLSLRKSIIRKVLTDIEKDV